MNKFLIGFIFSLAGGAAFAGPESHPPVQPPNLAVDIQAPGAVRAELQISIPGLKEDQRYELGTDSGSIKGGVFVSPEAENQVSIQAFDEHGQLIYKGEGLARVGKEGTPEFRIPLDGPESRFPVYARFGDSLLTVAVARGEGVDPMLQLTLLDPLGNHIEFGPDDLEWLLPEGLPTIPYSCFNNSLCILEWKPTREQEIIYVCYREWLKGKSCFENPPPDLGRHYVRVTVGKNHTCALTNDSQIFCWGDNNLGQLGSPTPTGCPVSGRLCSAVPKVIHCLPGESCKYVAVAAGGDHTCAVDTNGKAWCWGHHIHAAGIAPTTSISVTGDPWPGEVWAHGLQPGAWKFVAIDTNVGHTCALTSTGDVYCWGSNANGELGQPTGAMGVALTTKGLLVNTGNKYKALATGGMHTCAIQQNGLLDCWGDNKSFQLTGNTNSANLITVTSKVPLLFNHGVSLIAAGASSTCTENAYQDAICWGSPANGTAVTSANAGHYALRPGYTRSIATELDSCGAAACTRTCLTDLGGGLFCGNWRTNALPAQLTEVPWPKGVPVISYRQVDVGPNHVCATTSRDDIWCFGFNSFGQFGTGTVSNVRTWEPAAAVVRQ